MNKKKKILAGAILALGALMIPVGAVAGTLSATNVQTQSATQKVNGNQTVIDDHYNIDMKKVADIGYDLNDSDSLQWFTDEVEHGFSNMLPRIVTYQGHSVTKEEVTKTVKSVELKVTKENVKVSSVIVYITLKDSYVWDNGSQVRHFTTNIDNAATVHDNYTVDMNKFYATGYKLDSDAHAKDFADALKVTWKFQDLLSKITSYKGQGVSKAEVEKTVESVSINYTHTNGEISSFKLNVTLKADYYWADGSKTNSFVTNTNNSTVVYDNYSVDMNKFYATGYKLDTDAHAKDFADALKVTWKFQDLLSKIADYNGQGVSKAEVEETVQSVSINYTHTNGEISSFKLNVTLKANYNWADGSKTNSFTTNTKESTVVHDNYSVDMNKFYATGYKLDTDAHAGEFANDLKVTWRFQDLLSKITSYNGKSVSKAEIERTVQSVSIIYTHTSGKITSFKLNIALKTGYVWSDGSQNKSFTTNIPKDAVINADFSLDIGQLAAAGYSFQDKWHADHTAQAFANNKSSMLSDFSTYGEINSGSYQYIDSIVKTALLSYVWNGDDLVSLTLNVTLKSGNVWSDGSTTKGFRTQMGHSFIVHDHYNISSSSLYDAGYNLNSDAAANAFAADLSKNFVTMLPNLVSYKDHTVSQEVVQRTVESTWVEFFHANGAISGFRVHITLNPDYQWSNGTQNEYFTTMLQTGTVVNDNFAMDSKAMEKGGIDFENVFGNKVVTEQIIVAFNSNYVNQLNWYSYFGEQEAHSQRDARIEINKVVQNATMSLTYDGIVAKTMIIHVTLKSGYIWDNHSTTKDFTSEII